MVGGLTERHTDFSEEQYEGIKYAAASILRSQLHDKDPDATTIGHFLTGFMLGLSMGIIDPRLATAIAETTLEFVRETHRRGGNVPQGDAWSEFSEGMALVRKIVDGINEEVEHVQAADPVTH